MCLRAQLSFDLPEPRKTQRRAASCDVSSITSKLNKRMETIHQQVTFHGRKLSLMTNT